MEPSHSNALPHYGLLRLPEIIGDPKRGTLGPIPLRKSAWLAGVRAGRYPKPVMLGLRARAWRVEDIRALIESLPTAN